jgi:hypothetical protein
LGAVLFCALLFAGLVHDFGQTEAGHGWFTGNPALAGILLALGYACMVLYTFARRRRRE